MRQDVEMRLFWHETMHILRDRLLNTCVPLLFKDVVADPDCFGNRKYYNFMNPQPTDRNPTPRKYEVTSLHLEVWEHVFKEGLVKAFLDPLFGTQLDMDTYVARCERYYAVFNDMIGGSCSGNDLPAIIDGFLCMMKDYLCRRLSEFPDDLFHLTLKDLLEYCRETYHARRYDDSQEADKDRKFYIEFENQSYGAVLLEQMDDIAADPDSHPKCRHFLVLAELIHTLAVYVYMVEYIRYYPLCKGDDGDSLTPVQKTGRKHNLFVHLSDVNYKTAYYELKAEKERNKKNQNN